MSAGLVGAVILSFTVAVTQSQRAALEDQSHRRLQGMTDGVVRIAQESIKNRDHLMLLSYLMHLQKEHQEFAFASVTGAERVSTIGADRPGLKYLTADASFNSHTLTLNLGFDAATLEAEIAKALDPLRRRTAAIAGVFVILGWLGALIFSRFLTAPLSALAKGVSAVKAGNLDVVLAAGGSDELGRLAGHFNEMTVHLKELTQFREDLLHTLTHELNAPLGGLKGYLELWRDNKIPEDAAAREEVLQTMTAAVLRMEQSLSNALGLFRAEAQQAPKRAVWISDLLRGACSLFAPEAAAKKITLVPPPDNILAYVHADPELLSQITSNLVSNAVKYTSVSGKVRLTLHGDEHNVRLEVEDNGVGISAEDLPHLFTKFYRAGPDGDQRAVKGTGLGLSIAQKAAHKLGGVITVDSELGRGTTFTVTLPKFAPMRKEAK